MSRTIRTPGVDPAPSAATGPAPVAPLSRRAALASLLALPLAACSGGGADEESGGSTASDAGDVSAAADLTVTDPWVKASEEGMTAAFGTLANGSDGDLLLIGATSDAAATVQLHETASDGSGGMSMQEKEGGFELPAGAELLFEPGGNHLMLMDLTAPLQPGDQIEITLQFEDGSELPFPATVKDFAGAQEDYAPEGASDGGGE